MGWWRKLVKAVGIETKDTKEWEKKCDDLGLMRQDEYGKKMNSIKKVCDKYYTADGSESLDFLGHDVEGIVSEDPSLDNPDMEGCLDFGYTSHGKYVSDSATMRSACDEYYSSQGRKNLNYVSSQRASAGYVSATGVAAPKVVAPSVSGTQCPDGSWKGTYGDCLKRDADGNIVYASEDTSLGKVHLDAEGKYLYTSKQTGSGDLEWEEGGSYDLSGHSVNFDDKVRCLDGTWQKRGECPTGELNLASMTKLRQTTFGDDDEYNNPDVGVEYDDYGYMKITGQTSIRRPDVAELMCPDNSWDTSTGECKTDASITCPSNKYNARYNTCLMDYSPNIYHCMEHNSKLCYRK